MLVPWWHVGVTVAEVRNVTYGVPKHPAVHALFAGLLPQNHPDIDLWLRSEPAARLPVPADHPALQPWIERNATTPSALPYRFTRLGAVSC